MARNGTGTYSVVNTFASGATITASGHNQNWSDLATEMTNSVAVDGQSTMTGPLKAASGTAAAPGITFGSDTDSGLYRIGANNVGLGVGGTKIIDVATTGATVTGDMNATTVKQNSFALLPVGVTFPYSGTSAPSGYLFCYGQAVSRTTYSALFAALSTTYGTGDGSTTFNLPDLRGRVVAGRDDMGGGVGAERLTNADDGLNGDTLGATGGGETQTIGTGNLPAYTPSGSISSTVVNGGSTLYGFIKPGTNVGVGGTATGGDQTIITSLITVSSSFTGTAQGGTSIAFGIVQPTIILNYIIFAGV
ncbi:MAG: phage tail protein [Arenimonas sp.]|jgi:microcystin-dependent protein